MPYFTENDLKSSIKSKKFYNVYFLYGDEKYLTSYYTNTLISKILDGPPSAFNFQKFTQDNLDIEELGDCIEAIPMISPSKCVLISNLDIEKLDQKDLKKLKNIISDMPETSILIFQITSIEINLKKSSKWKNFIDLVSKNGICTEFHQLSKQTLEKQLISWCKKLNTELPLSCAQKIVRESKNSLTDLKNQVEKLCAFCENRTVTEQDIDLIVDKNLEANVFDLVKNIVTGNCTTACKKLNIIMSKKEEPISILAVISSVYIDIYRVKIAMANGAFIKDICNFYDYKRKEFRLDNAKKNSRYFSIENIRLSLNLLIETDFKLKSSKTDNKILLEELIVKLCMLVQGKNYR